MVFFVAVAIAIIAACAAGSWWWVSTRLATSEATSVYDIEEAIDFCAARLPAEVGSRLDRDTVRGLLGLHVAFLRRAGIATFGGVDEVAMAAGVGGDSVVAHEDEAVDYVLGRVEEVGPGIADVDVVVIVDLSNRYLDHIGAFGPSVPIEQDGSEPG